MNATEPNKTASAQSHSTVGLGDFHPPACGVSRAEWHDKAWALYHARTFNDQALHKVSIHTMRAVFDATYDALFVSPNV
jgi:hypothetical protein